MRNNLINRATPGMPRYAYTSAIDYISKLKFDYMETYSFQRGTEFERINKTNRQEIEILKVRKQRRNNLTSAEKIRLLELQELTACTAFIVNDKGQLHASSEKKHRFKSCDPRAEQLKDILQTVIKEIPYWMCAPVYRDAIVFYDSQHRIISTLNICFSCEYMATKIFRHINADTETYKLLKQYFIELGHAIEDE